jgi:hypothetical protein
METMNVMNMCIAAMLKGLKRKLERGDELTVSDRRYLIRCLPTTPC